MMEELESGGIIVFQGWRPIKTPRPEVGFQHFEVQEEMEADFFAFSKAIVWFREVLVFAVSLNGAKLRMLLIPPWCDRRN